ncbi:MAG: ferritin-like domain-containing protein [Actinomycetota bacterium]
MDLSSDHLRREARETQVEHNGAMRSMRELVARLFNGEDKHSARVKSDLVLGGFDRRRFLQVGGLSVVSAAVLAACGGSDDNDSAGGAGSGSGSQASLDVTILRTASSLERLAVDVYNTAIASGLVTTAAIGDAAKLFRDQHLEHAALFEGATTAMGGQAFTTANPAVLAQLDPAIKALRDEKGVVQLAHDLEKAAAATYFSTVGAFEDASLNKAAMSVGGVEARHVAVLAGVLTTAFSTPTDQVPGGGFQTKDGAVAAGVGVS